MNRTWEVVRHTGSWMHLECGTERLEIQRPKEQFATDMFIKVRPGQSIGDGVVALFQKGK